MMRAVTKTLGVGLLAAVAAVGALTLPASAASAATPGSGFAYGTDSWTVSGTGSAPFKEPVTGGSYSGYIGMAGNWARWGNCKPGNMLAWSPINAAQANAD